MTLWIDTQALIVLAVMAAVVTVLVNGSFSTHFKMREPEYNSILNKMEEKE